MISPKALTENVEQLDILLTHKLCQMSSAKAFLFPQRSCLGKLGQVHMKGSALSSQSMAESIIQAGEEEESPKGSQMFKGTDCQNKNVNTESMASSYLQISSQPLFNAIC